MSEELKRYVVALTGATRTASGVQLGASPRRVRFALMKAAQALALFDGLDFVTPEQIQELAGAGDSASVGDGAAGAVFRG